MLVLQHPSPLLQKSGAAKFPSIGSVSWQLEPAMDWDGCGHADEGVAVDG